MTGSALRHALLAYPPPIAVRPRDNRAGKPSRAAQFLLVLCIGWALAVAPSGARAQDLQPLPELRGPVTDLTETLSPDQRERLDAALRAFETRKGSQIAVVIVPTTQPETIEQYSIRLAEQAKVGRKSVDDGIIVLLAMRDRKSRIEVGYGLEGAVPDIVASTIRREVMNPYFRNGDFFGGLQAGTQALMKRIDGEELPPAWQGDRQEQIEEDFGSWIMVAIMLVVVFGGILTRVLGRLFGSAAVSGLVGSGAYFLTGVLLTAGVAATLAFIFALALSGMFGGVGRASRYEGPWTGGWTGGGWSGGGWSGGSGGWSGGGGGFGGGGASGSWDD